MKCIKYSGVRNTPPDDIRRVTDEVAEKFVKSGNWTYCPKSEWKAVNHAQETTSR